MRKTVALLSLVSLCVAQNKWNNEKTEWDDRDKINGKSCSNLTQVLDNWKYAIMHQVKDLLVNDHASVLPEYVRIQPLSEALGDLYKQFNTLKENLGKLMTRIDKVESFVDDLQTGRLPKPPLWNTSRQPNRRVLPNAAVRGPYRSPGPDAWSHRARAHRGPGV